LKKYYASKHLWIPFVFAFTGIIILFSTLIDYFLYCHADTNNGKKLLMQKPGQYSEMFFDEILMNNLGYPVCVAFGYYSGDYYRYVIVEKDAYIQVELSPMGDAVKRIKEFQSGRGDRIGVTVKAIWSDAIELDPELISNANDKAICKVVFREVDKKAYKKRVKNKIVLAGGMILVSFALLFTPLGIHRRKDDLQNDQQLWAGAGKKTSYNKEGELERALKRKEELMNEQKKMKRKFLLFVFVALFGGIGFIKLYVRFEETFPLYPTIFMAIVFYYGLIHAWKALLNTNWSLAVTISKRFSIESLSVKIENLSITIGRLRRQINAQNNELSLR